ncbi:MAG: right-handed parallel beta-helix repeat-containing protein [Anaerolineales bacterium]|nr:right-handed parallel beta-helix repeat-containing protein [Anaerolineales bacterium]
MAAGTYNVIGRHDGAPFAHVDIHATIIGAGETTTIFDAGDTYGGLYIFRNAQVQLRQFTIQNVRGTAPDSCINIRGEAQATIENVIVRHCVVAGITNLSNGLVTLTNVTSTENIGEEVVGGGDGVVNLGEMHIQGGSFSGNPGLGIRSHTTLTAIDVRVENNQRDGVVVYGPTELRNLTILNNGLDLSFRSGLLLEEGADVSLFNSRVENNQYGIQLRGGLLHLTETLVANNPRTGLLIEGGEVRMTDSTVSNNGSLYYNTSLGGGISNKGVLGIHNSQITGNGNGGIMNWDDGRLSLVESDVTGNIGGLPAIANLGNAVIERSLVANNTVNDVVMTLAAVDNLGSMVIENSTISNNNGYGVAAGQGRLLIEYSTIAENAELGLAAIDGAAFVSGIANSLIVKNGQDCELSSALHVSPYPLMGYNLSTDRSCGFPTIVSAAEIGLGPLADNGGPTFTHALLDDSPALDAATGGCPSSDQRSLARPVGPACDVGAYEAGATMLSLESEDTELEFATVTPGSGPNILVVIPRQTYNCRHGNSTLFDVVDTLMQGAQYTPVGIGPDKLWLQFRGPSFGRLCWAPTEGFTLFLDDQEITVDVLPETLLSIVLYPPLPTLTSTPLPTETPEPQPIATPTCTPQQIQNQQCP